MSSDNPHGAYMNAQAALQRGDADSALSILDAALKAFPASAELWNGAANIYKSLERPHDAKRAFAEAHRLAPDSLDYAINLAIVLGNDEGADQALAVLSPYEETGTSSARYCSVRANAARLAGDKAQAAHWYDAALAVEPNRAKALAGRAFVAMDRSEPDAADRFDRALAVDAANPDLWLAKARVLDEAGDNAGARTIVEAITEQGPHWLPGLRYLAELRLGAGEKNFADHFEKAHQRLPSDPNIMREWTQVLAGNSQYQDASEVAARGRATYPDVEDFALIEAIHAGEAGDDARAETLFSQLQEQSPSRWQHEARHRIRRGELEQAGNLLAQALDDEPWSVSAWALTGIIWRLSGDPRADWLHEQADLVRLMPLEADHAVFERAIPVLHRLHDNSAFPLGQSLRGGTQTRNILFDRTEPELAALSDAILRTVNHYRETMPKHDAAHPILRLRDQPWGLAGSWSVRLGGGSDHHASHIHPQGIISSALYMALPGFSQDQAQAGWLEIGRPPSDLRLDLEPITTIQPKAGHMALFPSTLYHGTRPFAEGERMTVAFDVRLDHISAGHQQTEL